MNTAEQNNFARRIILDCAKSDKLFCVDTLGQTLRFNQIKDIVENCAGVLQHSKGVRPRNRVGIFLEDTVYWPIVFLACLYIGANPLLLFRNFSKKETIDLCIKADCDTVICNRTDEFKGFKTIPLDKLSSETKTMDAECYHWHDDEPCWWTLSSGSTNQNKLIVHKHSSFDNLFKASNKLVGVTEKDRLLMTGKMSFPWGLSYMIWSLFNKATLYIIHNAPAPSVAANILAEHKITKFLVTPFLLNKMCNNKKQDMPLQTEIYVSGEPLTKILRQKVKSVYNKQIYDAYGLSEAFACVAIQTDDVDFDNMGNVGEGIEFKIINEQGQKCALGEKGELYIKSPAQALMYWKSHEMSKKTFIGEWIRTGDLVIEEEKKKLVFLGRQTSYIKIKGLFVNPDQIEAIISDQPGVDECLVSCSSHEGIQQLYAKIKPSVPDLDLKAFRQHLSTKLSGLHMPKDFQLVNSIPRTVNLKKKRQNLL
tara:strand:- start:3114 stop:4553 length:1440 start_codon:yes stop_codon:yes gene_type:complete